MKTRVFLLVLLSTGCAGLDSTGTSTERGESGEDEVGATRASRESVAAEVPPSSTAAPAPASSRPPFVARVVDATHGENGRGEVVPAASPIAFDLDAGPWPVRAMDPVLLIGELRFRHYTYPSPGLLRFIAADRATLPEGAEVAMQWGDDASSRRVVASALALP